MFAFIVGLPVLIFIVMAIWGLGLCARGEPWNWLYWYERVAVICFFVVLGAALLLLAWALGNVLLLGFGQ